MSLHCDSTVCSCADVYSEPTTTSPAQQPVALTVEQYSNLMQHQQQLSDEVKKLTARDTSLATAVSEMQSEMKQQSDQLRGAHNLVAWYKKGMELRDKKGRGPAIKSAVYIEGGHKQHAPLFMAGWRIIKRACILSHQKASITLDPPLMQQLLASQAPNDQLGCEVSPSMPIQWNIFLGEVDQMNLSKQLSCTSNGMSIFADKSNTGHDVCHIMGVHVSSDEIQCPFG